MNLDLVQKRRKIAPRVLLALVVPTFIVEVIALIGDTGVLGDTSLRWRMYRLLSLHSGVIQGAYQFFPFQWATMFITHAFLSGGIIHIVINMYTLWSLGNSVILRAGPMIFAVVYVTSLVLGGLTFGLGYDIGEAKVGPSAGLFGLAAAIITWNLMGLSDRLAPLLPIGWIVALLAGILFASYWRFGELLGFSLFGGMSGGVLAALVCAWYGLDRRQLAD